MPTPRSPDTDKRSDERKRAEKIYLDNKGNMKLVEIAEKLKVPANKIRKWKSMDGWEAKLHPQAEKVKKKQVERSTSDKGSVPPKKRGAPKGNQNSKGVSKGKGNPHPSPPPDMTKHGGYSKVYWDTLDDEEKALIEDIPKDEEQMLIEQIQLFSVRERRIMQAINKYRRSESPVALAFSQRSERKRSFESKEDEDEYKRRIDEKVANEERLPGSEYNVFTQTDNKDQIIARLESELSNVQSKKTKAIEALSKIRFERQKIESESAGNDAVDDWIAAVLGEDVIDDENE